MLFQASFIASPIPPPEVAVAAGAAPPPPMDGVSAVPIPVLVPIAGAPVGLTTPLGGGSSTLVGTGVVLSNVFVERSLPESEQPSDNARVIIDTQLRVAGAAALIQQRFPAFPPGAPTFLMSATWESMCLR